MQNMPGKVWECGARSEWRANERWLVHLARCSSNRLVVPCVAGHPLPLLGSRILWAPSYSPQSALRGRGARPWEALLFWLRGGNSAPRPRGGELSSSVWISLLSIATSSIRTKMRPPWTMARPPASHPRLPPPERNQALPRSSVAQWPGTAPPPPRCVP